LSPSVRELLEDLSTREEAVRTQARHLAAQRNEARAAIDREAARLMAAARDGIEQLVEKARRELADLAAHAAAIERPAADTVSTALAGMLEAASAAAPSATDGSPKHSGHDRLAELEQALRDLVQKTRPTLDDLQQQADALGSRPSVEPFEPIAVEPIEAGAQPPEITILNPGAEVDTVPIVDVGRQRHGGRRITGIVAVAVAALLAMLWWRNSPRVDADTRRATVGSSNSAAGSAGSSAVSTKPEGVVPPALAAGPAPAGSTAATPGAPSAAATTASAAAKPWSIRIQTREPVWIRTTVDGTVDAGRLFAAGESRTIEAAHDVSIRAGNAGVVLVSVKGGPAAPLGRVGEVVTRRFAVGDSGAAAGAAAPAGAPAAPPIRPVDAPARAAEPATPADGVKRERRGGPTEGREAELTIAAKRWLDGYYRRDQAVMSSVATQNTKVVDDRSENERLPPGLEVSRVLDDVSSQFVGDSGLLTGRVTEQSGGGGNAKQTVSWVSLMWMREGDSWRLIDVRIISEAGLKQRGRR